MTSKFLYILAKSNNYDRRQFIFIDSFIFPSIQVNISHIHWAWNEGIWVESHVSDIFLNLHNGDIGLDIVEVFEFCSENLY